MNSLIYWSKDQLLQVLTSGKNPVLTDPGLIAAFKTIDRKEFLPMDQREKAYSDIKIPIGYGEYLTHPVLTAQMLSHLKPKFGGKYLDIGTGTGWVAAILAFVAGANGTIYSIERVQWLWDIARKNIAKYNDKISKTTVLYRDGLEGLVNQAPFDGIHISFSLDESPENLKHQLKVGGILVYPTHDYHLKVVERTSEDEFVEELIPGFSLDKGKTGVA